MLADAHHQETVPPGRQHAPSLDIAELMVEVAEEVEEKVAEVVEVAEVVG